MTPASYIYLVVVCDTATDPGLVVSVVASWAGAPDTDGNGQIAAFTVTLGMGKAV